VILALVEEEHPQVIAVLLLLLEPEVSAQILSALPPEIQPLIVERIAKISEVPSETLDMLDQMLTARIERRYGGTALKAGGPREAANLINLTDPEAGKKILPSIEQRDAELANKIEEEMFTFEMLFELNAKDMGRLLRDVENDNLITALKGLKENEQTPFFAAMSSRAADGVRDEMELLPKLRKSDVIDAQKAIIDVARKLADEGEISIGAADGDFI
jgi:flagellar motor switch protein FliG